MARIAEAVMLGLCAGLLAAAAAVASEDTVGSMTVWAVALIAGLAMGAAWLIEMRPRPAEVAGRIDHGLRLGGALVAAWEVETHGRRGRLGLLLGKNLRGSLRVGTVLRAALPNSIPLVAAPVIGVAALFLALDGRAQAEDPLASVALVIGGVSQALGEARDQALDQLSKGELDSDAVSDLNHLLRDARELAGQAERLDREPESRTEVINQVQRLTRRVEQALERHAAQPELARPLERALAIADAACLACESERGSDPAAGSDPRPDGSVARDGEANPIHAGDQPPLEASSAAREGPGAGAASADQDGLAKGGGEGTMSGPRGQQGAPGADSTVPTGPGAGTPGGVELGAWWPDRHAGILSRYLDRPSGAASSSD